MSDESGQPCGIKLGQKVKLLTGIFEGFEAIVESVDIDNDTVHAGIHIFGRVTPVELRVADCQPLE